jgi:hypothetical protein
LTAGDVGGARNVYAILPNQWLQRYAKAMEEELVELKAELRWKWWSKDGIDLQNMLTVRPRFFRTALQNTPGTC